MSPVLVQADGPSRDRSRRAASDFGSVLDGKEFRLNAHAAGACPAACSAAIGYGIVATGTLSIWFNRNVLLGERTWPQKTYLVIERKNEDGTVVFPRGEDWTQIVTVTEESKVIPEAVYIDFRRARGRADQDDEEDQRAAVRGDVRQRDRAVRVPRPRRRRRHRVGPRRTGRAAGGGNAQARRHAAEIHRHGTATSCPPAKARTTCCPAAACGSKARRTRSWSAARFITTAKRSSSPSPCPRSPLAIKSNETLLSDKGTEFAGQIAPAEDCGRHVCVSAGGHARPDRPAADDVRHPQAVRPRAAGPRQADRRQRHGRAEGPRAVQLPRDRRLRRHRRGSRLSLEGGRHDAARRRGQAGL